MTIQKEYLIKTQNKIIKWENIQSTHGYEDENVL